MGSGGGLGHSVLERERKRALGIYYTPPEAARVLAQWAIRNPTDTVLEPSFGGCSMLAAAVDVFKSLGNDHPSMHLYGYDIDSEAFAYLANLGLENVEEHFKKQDFLQSEPGKFQVNAVLANPPFVSYHRSDSLQREIADAVRKRYLPELPKRSSLWAHFLLHSLSFLKQGGRMAFVLPTAVGTADYAQPLMEFICRHFHEVDLIHVADRLFIEAGTDERISLLFLNRFKRHKLPSLTPIRTRQIGNIREIGSPTKRNHQFECISQSTDLRNTASIALSSNKENVFRLLGDFANVQIGEVVGDVSFFVRPFQEWKQLGINEKYLFQILTRSAQVKGVVIPKSRVPPNPSGVPFLLVPPRLRQPNSIRSLLSQYPLQAIKDNRTFEKRIDWFRCSYSNNADAFICSMNHDYPKIISNEARISCSNAFYKIEIYSCHDYSEWLPMLALTTPFRLSAEVHGRVRGSGGIKLEPSDVKKLVLPCSLPKVSNTEFREIRLRINLMLSNGEIDAASQFADSIVYLQPGLYSAHEMANLRLLRLKLTSHRITKPNRKTA